MQRRCLVLALTVLGQAVSTRPQAHVQPEACGEDSEISLLQQWSAVAKGRSRGVRESFAQKHVSQSVSSFEDAYPWDHHPDKYQHRIKGYRPQSSEMFPVYVYLPGTLDEFATPHDLELLQYMSHKGFVAATIEYDNGDFCYEICKPDVEQCTRSFYGSNVTLLAKAKQIKVALDSVCNTYHADCDKGLAVMGHGQGGFLSLLLATLDSRISAVLPMGVGLLAERVPGMQVWERDTQCIMDASISKQLPRSKRRYVNSERGGLDAIDRKNDNRGMMQYSGYACGDDSQIDCIQADGSGYYIVPEREYDEATDHHAAASRDFFVGRHPIREAAALPPRYKNCGAQWCMQPSLNWLAAAAKRPDLPKDKR